MSSPRRPPPESRAPAPRRRLRSATRRERGGGAPNEHPSALALCGTITQPAKRQRTTAAEQAEEEEEEEELEEGEVRNEGNSNHRRHSSAAATVAAATAVATSAAAAAPPFFAPTTAGLSGGSSVAAASSHADTVAASDATMHGSATSPGAGAASSAASSAASASAPSIPLAGWSYRIFVEPSDYYEPDPAWLRSSRMGAEVDARCALRDGFVRSRHDSECMVLLGQVDVLHRVVAGGASGSSSSGVSTLASLSSDEAGPIYVSKTGKGKFTGSLVTYCPNQRKQLLTAAAGAAVNQATDLRLVHLRLVDSLPTGDDVYRGLAAFAHMGYGVVGFVYAPPPPAEAAAAAAAAASGQADGEFIIRWRVWINCDWIVDNPTVDPKTTPPEVDRSTREGSCAFLAHHAQQSTDRPKGWSTSESHVAAAAPCRTLCGIQPCPDDRCRLFHLRSSRSHDALLSRADFNDHSLPQPTLPEHHRIISEIQALMRPDAGMASFRTDAKKPKTPKLHQLAEMKWKRFHQLDEGRTQHQYAQNQRELVKTECRGSKRRFLALTSPHVKQGESSHNAGWEVEPSFVRWGQGEYFLNLRNGVTYREPKTAPTGGTILSSHTGTGKTICVLLSICAHVNRWRKDRAVAEAAAVAAKAAAAASSSSSSSSTAAADPVAADALHIPGERHPVFLIICHDAQLRDQWEEVTQEMRGLRALRLTTLQDQSAPALMQVDTRTFGQDGIVIVAQLHDFSKSKLPKIIWDGRPAGFDEVPFVEIIADECQFLSGSHTLTNIGRLQSTFRSVLSATLFDEDSMNGVREGVCNIDRFKDTCEFLRMSGIFESFDILERQWKCGSYHGIASMYALMQRYSIRHRENQCEGFPKQQMTLYPVYLSPAHRLAYNTFCAIILRNRKFSHGRACRHMSHKLLQASNKEQMAAVKENYDSVSAGWMPLYVEEQSPPRLTAVVKSHISRCLRPDPARTAADLMSFVMPDHTLHGNPHARLRLMEQGTCDLAGDRSGGHTCHEDGTVDYPLPVVLPCGHIVCVLCCYQHERAKELFVPLPEDATTSPTKLVDWLQATSVVCPVSSCAHRFTLELLHSINVHWMLVSESAIRRSKGGARKKKKAATGLETHLADRPELDLRPDGAEAPEPSQVVRMAVQLAREALVANPQANALITTMNEKDHPAVSVWLEDEMVPSTAYAWCGTGIHSRQQRIQRAAQVPVDDIIKDDLARFQMARYVIRGHSEEEAIRSFNNPYPHQLRATRQELQEREDAERKEAGRAGALEPAPPSTYSRKKKKQTTLASSAASPAASSSSSSSSSRSRPCTGVLSPDGQTTLAWLENLPSHLTLYEHESCLLFEGVDLKVHPSVQGVMLQVSVQAKTGHLEVASTTQEGAQEELVEEGKEEAAAAARAGGGCRWDHSATMHRVYHLNVKDVPRDIYSPLVAPSAAMQPGLLQTLEFRPAPMPIPLLASIPENLRPTADSDLLVPSEYSATITLTLQASTTEKPRRDDQHSKRGSSSPTVVIPVTIRQSAPLIRRLLVLAHAQVAGLNMPHASHWCEIGFILSRANRLQLRGRPRRIDSDHKVIRGSTVVGAGTIHHVQALAFNEQEYEVTDEFEEANQLADLWKRYELGPHAASVEEDEEEEKENSSVTVKAEEASDVEPASSNQAKSSKTVTKVKPRDAAARRAERDNQFLLSHVALLPRPSPTQMAQMPQFPITSPLQSSAVLRPASLAVEMDVDAGAGVATPSPLPLLARVPAGPGCPLGLDDGHHGLQAEPQQQPRQQQRMQGSRRPENKEDDQAMGVPPPLFLRSAFALPASNFSPASSSRPAVGPWATPAAGASVASAATAASPLTCGCGSPGVMCEQCESPFCHTHFLKMHRSAALRQHRRFYGSAAAAAAPPCVQQCGRDAGAECRGCPPKLRFFCKECWEDYHDQGELLQHQRTALVTPARFYLPDPIWPELTSQQGSTASNNKQNQ